MMVNESDPRSNKMKREMTEYFAVYEYDYREGEDTDAEVVYEDSEVIVVADHTGHEINEWVDSYDVDRDALSEFFHKQAKSLCDYSWSTADPVIFDKSEENP